jgi:TonB family protein
MSQTSSSLFLFGWKRKNNRRSGLRKTNKPVDWHHQNFTADPKLRIFLVPKDHAPRIAHTRAQERKTSPEKENKIRSIHAVIPQYPKGSLIRGEIGTVRLRFDVSPEGKPEHIQIVHSQPQDTFDRVSRTALKRWRDQSLAEEPNKDRKDIEVTFYFSIEGSLGYDGALEY